MAVPRSELSGELWGNRNGRANRPPAKSGESAARGMTSMSNIAGSSDSASNRHSPELTQKSPDLMDKLHRIAADGEPPGHRAVEAADEKRLGLVSGQVGHGALDSLEPAPDVQQREFARDRSADFGAKFVRVRHLARRDAVSPLRQIVAPKPHAVGRRQVDR